MYGRAARRESGAIWRCMSTSIKTPEQVFGRQSKKSCSLWWERLALMLRSYLEQTTGGEPW